MLIYISQSILRHSDYIIDIYRAYVFMLIKKCVYCKRLRRFRNINIGTLLLLLNHLYLSRVGGDDGGSGGIGG